MADDLNLGEPLAQPFDFGGIQTPPFVSPQPQQKRGILHNPQDRMQAMKLAIMLPLAMKAGPGAVQGLLQGFAQHEQTQYTRGRQDRLDADQESQRQAQQQYQQQQIRTQQLAQQRQFVEGYAKGLPDLDTPEAIDAYTKLYTSQAGAYGVTPDQLSAFSAPYREPSRLQRKAAEKAVAKLKSQYGEKWMETGAQFTHRVGDQVLTFQQLLEQAGMTPDPNAQTPEPKPETRSLDVQAADALARGDTATYERLLKVKKEMGQADDRSADPLNEAIKQARLAQLLQGGGLNPRAQQQVQSQAKAFDAIPAVKNTQVMAEAVSFAQGLDPNTKNPADDQALIYAFAKAMDPNSVVREGEYATVQKYARSWAESFGFNAARIFSNTAFLTPQARANMKRTIQQRFAASRGQYEAIRNSFVQKINKITGAQDGADYLTAYETAFPQAPADPTTPAAPVTVQPPARSGGAGPAAAPGANPFRR